MALLLLAMVLALSYLALVGRAVKRDKAIRYWQDRRLLRLRVTQERAHRRFLATVLTQLRALEGSPSGGSQQAPAPVAVARVLDQLYKALSVGNDDLAVVVGIAADGSCRIVQSRLSSGSRWKALKPGKRCELKGPLEQRLDELAEHHYAAESDIPTGRLCIAVLADRQFDDCDRELLDQLPTCLELLAGAWRQGRPAGQPTISAVE
ncbi:MAG TPA: hypothetical protein VF093_02210 [Solirubrobacterales bacterium]